MKKLIVLSLLCLVATFHTIAQPGTGTIAGKVFNTKKQPIADAIVIIMVNSMPKNGTTTDKDGNYSFKGLTPGKYDLKARSLDYKARIHTYISAVADKTTDLNFELYPKIDEFPPQPKQPAQPPQEPKKTP